MTSRGKGATTWMHDDCDRLVGVIAEDGEAVVYRYDVVGNIASIERVPAMDLAILNFSPGRGGANAVVRINGTGFPADGVGVRVRFGDADAEVVSATHAEIVARVPPSATTGAVLLEVGGRAVVSDRPFTVIDDAPPDVTELEPPVAESGEVVRLRGRRLVTSFGPAQVLFGNSTATIVAAASDEIQVAVPALASSGHLRVASPYGEVLTIPDFFWVPPSYTRGPVEAAVRLEPGVGQLVALSAPGRVGLAIYDAQGGDRISYVFADCSVERGRALLYGPDGQRVGDPIWIAEPFAFGDPRPMPLDGTYTLVVDPDDGVTGEVMLAVHRVPDDVVADVAVGAAAVSVATTAPGQNIRVNFDATVGEHLGIVLLNVELPGGSRGASLSVLEADGTVVVGAGFSGPRVVDVGPFPATATYTILIEPDFDDVMSIMLALVAPVSFAATVDGAPVNVATTTAGQAARVSFPGTAGRRVSLGFARVEVTDPRGLGVAVQDATGDTVAMTWVTGDSELDLADLPVTGPYEVVFGPDRPLRFDLDLSLSSPSEFSVTVGGAPVQAATTRAGQDAHVNFLADQASTIIVAVSGLTSSESDGFASLTLLGPDGAAVESAGIGSGAVELRAPAVPGGGQYMLVIDPWGTQTVSARVTLSL